MKKIIIASLVFLCIIFGIYFIVFSHKLPIINSVINNFPTPTPLPTPSMKTSTVSWNDITYIYEWFEVPDSKKVSLLSNFTEKKSSLEIMNEQHCIAAINAGFYDTNNKPLGLFKNNTISTASIQSALLNGYLTIAPIPLISFEEPDRAVVALQTGPMLIVDGKKIKLVIKNDEHARRMIAGINAKGALVFMTIFVPETKVQGPQLADLPDIIEQINKTLPNPLVSAINLDGGNASMFKDKDVYIPEVLPIGSLFCLQE